ncbi:MAG: pyridoxal phosphate-dependent aminotransferase [Deltaproteobacteria bacterium]|nr:pyridoxal phosphate-dependent aminotransferase [Deltaproteobacteria bacterium]
MPRFPEVAESSVGLSDAVFSKLVARARQNTERNGSGNLYALHVGDTYLDPYEGARAEAIRTIDHGRLHNYSPVQGEPVLLDAILAHVARRSGVTLDRELVQVVSGATAGIAVVVDALLSPGDELLLLAPFWPLVRGTTQRRGGRAIEVPFWDRLNVLTTVAQLEAHLESFVTPKTAAIYVNTPHNPTGSMLSAAHLDAIANVAERHGLWVIADEVYEELWFEEEPASAWTHPRLRPRAVVVHSVSKAYGLAGARVGFVHGPASAMQAIRGVQTFMTYCAPRPFQLAAARVLVEGRDWIATTRAHYRELAHRAADALSVPRPPGGTFLFVDTRGRRRDGESPLGFLERCVDQGVLLTPGTASGKDYEDWVRLCFTTLPPTELDEALAILRRILEDR